MCGLKVAVSNALPSLEDIADVVTVAARRCGRTDNGLPGHSACQRALTYDDRGHGTALIEQLTGARRYSSSRRCGNFRRPPIPANC